MDIKIGDNFKAGEICPETGIYHFNGYFDGSQYPRPPVNESTVKLNKGQYFPEIKSLNRPCIWELISKNLSNLE